MKNKTRTTAARLDRFKPWADTWKKRRAEEGFAAFVECVFENNKAIKSAWQKFKAINWWHEIKEAFSFSEYDRYSLEIEAGSRRFSCYCSQCHKPYSGEYEEKEAALFSLIAEDISSYKLYCPTCCKENKRQAARLAAGFPTPFNCTPYYIAALVLCALLILDGFLTNYGFVDYSPILK